MCVSSSLRLPVTSHWQLINHAEQSGVDLSILAFERPISIFSYPVECYDRYLLVVDQEELIELPLMYLENSRVTVLIYGSNNLHLSGYNYVVNSKINSRVVVSEFFSLEQLQHCLVDLLSEVPLLSCDKKS